MGKKSSRRDSIRDYEQIREILRIMSVYGCYTGDELQEKLSIGEKTYKNIVSLIKSYLPDEAIIKQRRGRKDIITFSSQMFDVVSNHLIFSYQTKNFGRFDVGRALLYGQLLCQSVRPMSREELEDALVQLADEDVDEEYLYPDPRTCDDILDKLVEIGYLRKDGAGYAPAPDLLADTSEDLRERLRTAVDLFSHLIFPATSGGFLLETLEDYERLRSPAREEERQSPFLIWNNHFAHVLDDELLVRLLEGIEDGKKASFVYRNQSGREREISNTVPQFIIVDQNLGRRYLLCSGEQGMTLYRLDRTKEVVLEERAGTRPEQADPSALEALFRESYSGTQPSSGVLATLKLAVVRDAPKVLRKLWVLCPDAVVEETADGWTVELRTGTLMEWKPWLRQHLGKVCLLSCSDGTFLEEMDRDLQQWREMYGII